MATRRKKSTLAAITKRVATRKRAAKKKKTTTKRKSKPRSNPTRRAAPPLENPDIMPEIVALVVPGVASYAATRLFGRIGFKMALRRSPQMAKHAGPWSSVLLTAVGAYVMDKSETLREYYMPWLIGSSIASIQGVVQTYVPQYGWILNDYHLNDGEPLPGKNGNSKQAEAEQLDAPQSQGAPLLSSQSGMDDDLGDVLDDGESMKDLYAGSFSSNW